MKLDKNTCIRLDRDAKQIESAKQFLKESNTFTLQNAKIFNLLGNQVRLNIVMLLDKEQKLCVCDLSEILEMKIPAVSQHLRKLKDGGLLFSVREGTVLFYSIVPEYKPYFSQIVQKQWI